MKTRHFTVFTFFILFLSSTLKPCTSFVIEAKGTLLLGKNLDWSIGDGFIVQNNRGVTKSAFLLKDGKPVKWQSRYGSISFNQFGKEFPLGGMNETGLVIEEMSYSISKYPPPKTFSINEFQWIQYHLDTSNSVDQVIESLDEIMISPFLFRLHYLICDKSGNIAIIEFINGKSKIYSGDQIVVPVLTNNSYENSLKYLRHHKGFGGDRIVSKSSASQERFVRAADLLRNFSNSGNTLSNDKAFEILDSVKQNDTQWSIVYNLIDREILFHTLKDPTIQSISFDDLQFNETEQITYLNSTNPNKFEDYSDKKNRQLLTTVFGKLCAEGEITKEDADQILSKLDDYHKEHSYKK